MQKKSLSSKYTYLTIIFLGSFSGFGSSQPPTTTRRYHAHQAAFSRRTTVCTIEDFLCQRFSTKHEDLRLWHFKDDSHMRLLVDPNAVLEEIGIREDDAILVEVRIVLPSFNIHPCSKLYIRLLHKPYVNGVNLTGQNLSLKCCQSLE